MPPNLHNNQLGGAGISTSQQYAILGAFIAIMVGIAQLELQSRKMSPLQTHQVTTSALIFVVFMCCVAWATETILKLSNIWCGVTFIYTALILGLLAIVLIMLILTPMLGWIAFGVWIILLAVVAGQVYKQYCQQSPSQPIPEPINTVNQPRDTPTIQVTELPTATITIQETELPTATGTIQETELPTATGTIQETEPPV